MHYGSPLFMSKEWKAFKERIANEPNSLIAIVGDMMDNGTKSSVGDSVYQQTVNPNEQKDWLCNELEPIKDKIVCGIGGNHEFRSYKDVCDDMMYDVFARLRIEDKYRANACFVIIQGKGVHKPTYTIAVLHGSGGGMYIGSSANKTERYGMAIDNLDVLITGHTHKPLSFPVGKLRIDTHNKSIAPTQFTVVTCTSWLNYGGYALRGMCPPVAHIIQEIHFDTQKKQIRVIQ